MERHLLYTKSHLVFFYFLGTLSDIRVLVLVLEGCLPQFLISSLKISKLFVFLLILIHLNPLNY